MDRIRTLKSATMLKAENEIKAMTTIEGNMFKMNMMDDEQIHSIVKKDAGLSQVPKVYNKAIP